MAVATAGRKYEQWGVTRDRNGEDAAKFLGSVVGPIPRYLYSQLDDGALATQIKQRWMARRLEMGTRIIMDARLMRYMDPEQIRDHWQDMWTGAPLKKLQHSNTLSTPVINWPRAIVEAKVGLLAGNKPMAFTTEVRPWNQDDMGAATQADIVEKYLYRWEREHKYELTFQDSMGMMEAVGRRWYYVTTDPDTMQAHVDLPLASRVASFWQHDQRTLECAIISTDLLPGEAAAMFPEREAEIAMATQSPRALYGDLSMNLPVTTWNLNSTVTLLTCWYRTDDKRIGMVILLLNAIGKGSDINAIVLKREPDTGYPDIPLYCTPRFKMLDRPPDEAQGILYDIAPLVTMYDEIVGAGKDMLWRTLYPRYKFLNGMGRPPEPVPDTSIFSLRNGQDLTILEDTMNTLPTEQILQHLEDLIIILPGLNRYFLGSAPPSETSGEAMNAAINASIARLQPTRTEVQVGEIWKDRQVIGQSIAFARYMYQGRTMRMRDVLQGDYDIVKDWRDVNPPDAVKARQLSLAALRAGVISLDTAQNEWRILSPQDEQRKIARDRTNPILRPDAVLQTAEARIQSISAFMAMRNAVRPPSKQENPVKVSVTGKMGPVETAAALTTAGIQSTAEPVADHVEAPGATPGSKAAAAGRTVTAPPSFENNNVQGGVMPQDVSGAGPQ